MSCRRGIFRTTGAALLAAALTLFFCSRADAHVFRFRAPAGARSVAVAGSWNAWDAAANPLADADGDGVWEGAADAPDWAHYKFVVDGVDWVVDPENPTRADDGFGGENSVFEVEGPEPLPHTPADATPRGAPASAPPAGASPPISTAIPDAPPSAENDLWAPAQGHVFRYRAPAGTRSVFVAGSFNNWSGNATALTDADGDGTWEVAYPLPEGEHTYKFVVNGTDWIPDPANTEKAGDGYGGTNSVVRVGAGGGGAPSVRGDGLVDAAALAHAREARYVTRVAPGRAVVTLRLARDDAEAAALRWRGGAVEMPLYARDRRFDWFRAEVACGPETFAYVLVVRDGADAWEIDRRGLGAPRVPAAPFVLPPGGVFETPRWAREAVFYQIFPERFADGDSSNDPPGAKPWRSERLPESVEGWNAFYGGDLAGVAAHADHLADLGATAVYFCPLFASVSNHKYNHSDYYRIDDGFGGDTAFAACGAALRARGIRYIIDGVFNHSGDQHPYFRDAAARGPASPYYAWYRIHRWPFPAQFTGEGENAPRNFYDCWWGHGMLPDWNTENPEVRAHLFGAIEKWTRAGIDGWRLDVPNEVEHDFWRDFRRTVKAINPEAYTVGEIWENGGPWLQGDQFDATMNYPFRTAMRDFFAEGKIDAGELADRVAHLLVDLPPQVVEVQYNLLSSHDSERFWTVAGGRVDRVKQAVAFQFSFPGAPAIYYGEEIGLEGGKDPDNRRVFPWDEPGSWNRVLLDFYRTVIALRKAHPALRSPDYRVLAAEGRTFAAARVARPEEGGERLVVLFHASDAADPSLEIALPAGFPDGAWRDLLGGGAFEARGGRLLVPGRGPWAVAYLVPAV